MRIYISPFLTGLAFISFSLCFTSCKKINQATELGDDLIPAVDNVHTFEVALNTVAQNRLLVDTTHVFYNDLLALGDIDDPEFGHTHANFNFSIEPSTFGLYPFVKPDSLSIDSVVLSLSYVAAYGDTLNNGMQTVRVFEVDPNSGFNDTTLYKYSDAATDFATTGPELGSTTFFIRNLKDTVTLVRGTDTTLVSNVLRIRLNNSLATRFAQYDTTNAYKNDSIFNNFFHGLSIQADAVGNAFGYFNISDVVNTKLTVYFRYGLKDTASFDFYHATTRGQSNYINRQDNGNYLAYLNSGATDQIYLQSSPGSYVAIRIPSLDTFGNKVIHRAEIVAEKIPSLSDDVFTAPSQLMLDRKNKSAIDTVFMLQNDLVADVSGNVAFGPFGGGLLSDNTVRFNISRYVQNVITKHVSNDTLRLYAPLRAIDYNSNFNTPLSFRVIDAMAKGRIVLGGATYADFTKRLRLRIIYSDL